MIYTFKQFNNTNSKELVCPRCSEVLNRIDIEHFSLCPYCSFYLELTDDLEDFLLEPLVDSWAIKEQQQIVQKQFNSMIDL